MKKLFLCVAMVGSIAVAGENSTPGGVSIVDVRHAYQHDLISIISSDDKAQLPGIIERHRRTIECLAIVTGMDPKVMGEEIRAADKMLKDPRILDIYRKKLSQVENIQMGWDVNKNSCDDVIALRDKRVNAE